MKNYLSHASILMALILMALILFATPDSSGAAQVHIGELLSDPSGLLF